MRRETGDWTRRLAAAIACALCAGCFSCTVSTSEETVGVDHIEITPPNGDLEVGATAQLQATVFGAGNMQIAGRTITWSSSASTVVSVSQGGLVSAVSAGTATITASTGGVDGHVTVTVTPATPTGAVVDVYPGVIYQTMSGWEATAQVGELECNQSSLAIYRQGLLDRSVNELGLDRVRVELMSGLENPVDWFTQFRNGQISFATYKQHWYDIVNDNSDPFSINPAGFQWAALDYKVDNIVTGMRQVLAARGEQLYVNLNYVDFATSAFEHSSNPDEYAELIFAAFQHLHTKYGWVPDAVEISLEPDNTPNWTPDAIAHAIVAAGDRLKAAGYQPAFIAPSTTNAGHAVQYFDTMVQVPHVLDYLTDLSYHRYSGVSDQVIADIGARSTQYGVRTSMLEHIGSGYEDLYQDVSVGRNSAWSEYALAFCDKPDDGGTYYNIDLSTPANPVVLLGSRAKLLRQYFLFVRFGAQRIGTASGDARFAPLAWRNTNGKFVVVVKAIAGGSFQVRQLPAGTYGIKYTTPSHYDVDLADVVITTGGLVPANIPDAGVITIYQR